MDLKRRDFLKIIGATTIATTLPGCTPKAPKSLIPYIIPHEEIIPGKSVWYASVCRECPAGCGVNIRVREGRATKAEGNPLHPVNHGALCARGQASLQGLYNPERIQTPLLRTATGGWEPATWEKAEGVVVSHLQETLRQGKGRDVVWISSLQTGSLRALLREWLASVGSKNLLMYEPFGHEALKKGNERVFGAATVPVYELAGVDTIYSFGTDFLETWLSPVAFARGFAGGRGFGESGRRNTLAYFGPRLSMTAANADVWVDVHPDMLGNLALAFVSVVVGEGRSRLSVAETSRISGLVKGFGPEQMSWPTGLTVDRIVELGRAFARSPSSLAIAGGAVIEGEFGAQTVAAVNLLNYVCGNIGRSVRFEGEESPGTPNTYADMDRLVRQMERNQVPALFLSEVNPVFTIPSSSGIAAALANVPFIVACTSVMDETASLATLVLPIHTPLESWGDYEPREGVHGLMQPAMQPVFGTKMLGDILLYTGRRLGRAGSFAAADFHAYVMERWKTIHARCGKGETFEEFWVESLARGGVWEARPPQQVQLARTLAAADLSGPKDAPPLAGKTFTLLSYPSIAHYDGRGANKPWLQEMPDPITRLVWGSWIELSPDDAVRLGVTNGDRIQVSSPYARCELPAYIKRGLRVGCVAIPIGQGHTSYGRYAKGVGVNVTALLDPKPSADGSGGVLWFGTKVELAKLPGKIALASVQEAESEFDREIIQEIPLAALVRGGEAAPVNAPSLYPPQEYLKHHWGMAIDVDKCTGCSACVTACYAENNVPVVGKQEVMNGREMAWIRIDRYYADSAATGAEREATKAGFIPVLCQQCGAAPCETVCPVYAAYHTDEGLNGQVYNRCIGTRYCANNCPYKVRRFNWFDHDIPEPLNWQLNPDVTVRTKGVMEKCTFCVQRIVEGKNTARMEHRELVDGEIAPACQQACPAQAITFGDLKDPESQVSKLTEEREPRPYHMLEELNTRPAVTYLKRITA